MHARTSDPEPAPRRPLTPMGLLNVSGKTVLGVLVVAFLAMPLAETSASGGSLEAALISVIVIAGVLAVGGRRGSLLIAGSLGGAAVAARWAHIARPDLMPGELSLALATLTVGFVAWRFITHTMFARRVDADVLCTAIAAFGLVAVVWSLAYQIIDLQVPGSFAYTVPDRAAPAMRGEFALYFSMVTLCTVGYGDVVPTSHVARMAAMLEGAVGVFFVAVLVSRLVSLYTSSQQHSDR